MKNEHEVTGDTTVIFIDCAGGRKSALIDTEMLDKIKTAEEWFYAYPDTKNGGGYGYAIGVFGDECERKIMAMHRLVFNCPHGMVTDHINRNGMDNRIANLRSVTTEQNGQNRNRNTNNTAGYRNIYWVGECRKWLVQITVKGRRIYGGMYLDKTTAARAAMELRETHMPFFTK